MGLSLLAIWWRLHPPSEGESFDDQLTFESNQMPNRQKRWGYLEIADSVNSLIFFNNG